MFASDAQKTGPLSVLLPPAEGPASSAADALLIATWQFGKQRKTLEYHAHFLQHFARDPIRLTTLTQRAKDRNMSVLPLTGPSGRSYRVYQGSGGDVAFAATTGPNTIVVYPDSAHINTPLRHLDRSAHSQLAADLDSLWDARLSGLPFALQSLGNIRAPMAPPPAWVPDVQAPWATVMSRFTALAELCAHRLSWEPPIAGAAPLHQMELRLSLPMRERGPNGELTQTQLQANLHIPADHMPQLPADHPLCAEMVALFSHIPEFLVPSTAPLPERTDIQAPFATNERRYIYPLLRPLNLIMPLRVFPALQSAHHTLVARAHWANPQSLLDSLAVDAPR